MIELRTERWNEGFLYYVKRPQVLGGSMKNRMSSNQMAEWIHHDDYNLEFSQDQLIDEYFDCMIDCNDNYCRKVCTEILR